MPLTRIAAKSDLPACDEVKEIFANGRILCVANVNGEICAMDNICPHWGGPLGKGRIENGKLVCPWHGWIFDPKTGLTPRKEGIRIPVYKVRIKEEDVFVDLEETSSAGNGLVRSELEEIKEL